MTFNQSVKEEKLDSVKCRSPLPTASKKKNRKGGLSMFLSGALDDIPKDITPPPPPTPKREGPAWGGATFPKGKGLASLREIQSEQKKTLGTKPTISSISSSSKDRDEEDVAGDGKIRLSSFISSKPIPMASSGSSSQAHDGERGNTPPWQSSGTPPLSRPSLRDIQMQQVYIYIYMYIFNVVSMSNATFDTEKNKILKYDSFYFILFHILQIT